MIRKHPFIIFCAVITMMIGALVLFIQSAGFAQTARKVLMSKLTPDLGVEADFSGLSVKYFPPGLSILKPRASLKKHNIIGLPEGSQVLAERIDLNFKPIQMLTGYIRINEMTVIDGDIRLIFDRQFLKSKAKTKKSIPTSLKWDELFHINADSVGIENTRVQVVMEDPKVTVSFLAKTLNLSQWSGKGGVGYESVLDVSEVNGTFPKEWSIPKDFRAVKGRFKINSLGLAVNDFFATVGLATLKLNGSVDGNLLESQNLPFDASFVANGDPSTLKLPLDVGGKINIKGHALGNLGALADTVKADVEINGEQVHVLQWSFDQLQGRATAEFKDGSPEIHLERFEVTSQQKERADGVPGTGGKIKVSDALWKVGSKAPVNATIQLEHAHVHWLANVVKRQIFPLSLRISGQIQAEFIPPVNKENSDWSLKGDTALTVENLQLDNQKLGQMRPLRKIIAIPKIKVSGTVRANSTDLKFDPVNLAIHETKLRVTGGINFKNGFDISANGNAKLEEVGEIAEQPIRGQGSLSAHVHGPSSRVYLDFFPDIRDGEFLGLHLGEIKGKITLDEDPTLLLIENVQGKSGKTVYVGNGKLDLKATPETIDLKIDIPNGHVPDIIHVLQEKVRTVSWFPWSAMGTASAKVGITGTLDPDGVKIRVEGSGADWEYKSERFKRVILTGGLEKGTYYVDSMRAIKKSGRLSGMIFYHPLEKNVEEDIRWNLNSEDFTLADFDHMTRLDVPLKGSVSIQSRGETVRGFVESDTLMSLKAATVRGIPMPSSEFHMTTSNGVLAAKAEVQGSQGSLKLNYPMQEGRMASLNVDLQRFDFSHVFLMLNPKLIQDQELAAYLSGGLDLDFQTGKVELGSGAFALTEAVIAKKGVRFDLDRPGRYEIKNGTFRVDQLSWVGKEGVAKLTVNSSQAEVAGLITGDLHLGIIEMVTPVIQNANGTAKLDLSITGYLKQPDFLGKVSVNGGAVQVANTDLLFENIQGQVQLRQNHLIVKNLEADLATGRVLAKGTIDLFADRVPSLDLAGTLIDNKIKVFPFQFAKIRGGIRVHGTELPYLVEGAIKSDSALSKEKVLTQKKSVPGKDRFSPPTSLLTESNLPIFKLNIGVSAERNILVQNDLFDMELKGDLKIVNTLENPGILGTAEVIQGKMSFKDRVFQIQLGKADFDNPGVINPLLNLVSSTEVNRTKVQLIATGRMETLKIQLSSNPVMTEPEIISLLALGMSTDEMQKWRNGDRRAYEQGEAASLVLNSLDFNRDIQKRTGFLIQLDEATNSQLGTSMFRARTDSDSTSAPRIVVRRKLGKKLDVSAGSTVGVGGTNQRQVSTEYRFTPAFSVMGVWDQTEGNAVNTNDQTSYGVDLKLQKRFK